jgi:hypothetical protein
MSVTVVLFGRTIRLGRRVAVGHRTLVVTYYLDIIVVSDGAAGGTDTGTDAISARADDDTTARTACTARERLRDGVTGFASSSLNRSLAEKIADMPSQGSVRETPKPAFGAVMQSPSAKTQSIQLMQQIRFFLQLARCPLSSPCLTQLPTLTPGFTNSLAIFLDFARGHEDGRHNCFVVIRVRIGVL